MNLERLYTVLRAPHISEKTSRYSGESRQYAFKVARDAKKHEIKAAVEQLFNTKVQSVQVCNVKGKTKLVRGQQGARKSWKKAYVSLEKGREINIEKFD